MIPTESDPPDIPIIGINDHNVKGSPSSSRSLSHHFGYCLPLIHGRGKANAAPAVSASFEG